jgi:hypothetical protein
MRAQTCFISLFFVFFFCAANAIAQEGGSFSAYLVGTYDTRAGNTVLHVINPTAKDLEVYLAFFDADERPLRCKKEKLSHNDLLEVDVRTLELKAKLGVVKIVSLRDKRPVLGIVGFQRHLMEKMGAVESNLASVPVRILDEELKIIMDVCK